MTSANNQTSTLLKGLKILELFGGNQTRFTFHEIAASMGGSTEDVQTIIRTLESDGFLDRDFDNGSYRLGHKIFQLGMRYASEMEISQTILPYATSLCTRFKAAVNVGFQVGSGVVVAIHVDPEKPFMVLPGPGSSIPIHSSAMGKVLLAYQEEKHIRQTLASSDMISFTDKTENDIDHFLERLERVRQRGYSVDDEETLPGVCSIAAPILDHRCVAIAALGMTGPRELVDPENVQVAGAIREVGLQVSRLLGFPYSE